jgi:threonine dehydrogenase-like Zn-dependent dehydrogenase
VRKVRLVSDGGIEVEDAQEPEAVGDQVVVKVMASAISGTERRYYDGAAADPWAGLRDNTGHEAAGVVWKAQPGAGVSVGDRVALYGAYRHCGRCPHCLSGRWLFCQDDTRPPQAAGYHAQFVQIRADFCLPLPGDIDFDSGALLAAPFGAALRALKRLRLATGERLLIAGQGPLGLAATMIAGRLGASVIVSEPNEFRRGVALTLGAKVAVAPTDVAEMIAAQGPVQVALDCTGLAEGRLDCLQSVRPAGRVGILGTGGPLQLDPAQAGQIVLKEVNLIGSWYADPVEVLETAALAQGGLDLTRIVSHRFAIDEAPQAFATSFGGRAAKVILRPWS